MYPVLNVCPVCGDTLAITRLHCRSCDTTIEGRFHSGRLSQLSAEQLQFVEIFLQCEGKIKAVEAKLNVSYPTVRARLRDVITAMGFEVEEIADEPEPPISEQERKRILDDLAAGRISSAEAIAVLRGETV